MRDKFKKLTCIVAAATLAVTAASFAGCSDSYSNKVPGNDIFTDEAAVSNGGFAVEKGNYVYFINGAEEYTASNKYGDVVKGALMRISKTDLLNKDYSKTVTVVPMLFVAQNYNAGIYIYGDRVYYASPTTEKDQSGNIQNDWISFKSAKLDGTEVMKDYYFRSDDNATNYRYVEVEDVVYCLHVDDKTLYSYNTQTGKDTVLVSGAGSDFYFDTSDPESPEVYYTMAVTQDVDTANPSSFSYTQVYSVSADATVESVGIKDAKASYTVKGGKTYSFDASYLQDNLSGFKADDYTTYPYVNLGDLVLDGRGSTEAYTDTKFTDDEADKAATPMGYTYTIQSYQNGGLYYTRAGVSDTSSDGESSALYYLPDSVKNAEGWKSIQGQAKGNTNIDTVALNTTNASASALFSVKEENGKRVHSYIYTSDSKIYRNKAKADGTVEENLLMVPSASSATLWKTEGEYLYYYSSGSNGNNITRVNYTGTKDDYSPVYGLMEEDSEYKPAVILSVDWNSSWYKPEFIENFVLFSNAQSFGSTAYNYIYAVDLNGADGMMNAKELKAFNDRYEEVTDYIDEISDGDLKKAVQYYFRTGESVYFEDILKEAKEKGYKDHYLYSEYAINEFRAFSSRKKSENKDANDYTTKFKDEEGKYYDVESYFMNRIGKLKESDEDAIEKAWKTEYILTLPEESSTGWKTWQKVLLGVGIGVAVLLVGGGIAIFCVVRARKKAKAAAEAEIVEAGRRKPVIDTTDDKSIDVYADEDGASQADETGSTEADEQTEAADGEASQAEEADKKDE